MKVELIALAGFFVLAHAGVALAAAVDSLGDPLPDNAVQRLGTLRLRYGGVGGLAYLQDNRAAILTGSSVDIWDLLQGRRLSRSKVSDTALISAQLRSDGKTLLLGDTGGKVREWDIARQAELRAWDTGQKDLRTACYSPDEKRLLTAAATPPGLKEWDLDPWKLRIEIRSEMVDIRAGAIYGPGNTAILGGGYEHNLEHYDLATGKLLKKWCTIYQAKQVALSPDQKYVTVGVEDRAVEWSLETYARFRDYKPCPGEAGRILSVAYLPKANEVLCGGRDGSIHRWDRTTGKMAFAWKPHQSIVAPMCVSPDGQWVLSFGTGQVAETKLATGEPRIAWDRHIGSVQAVAFLPSGKQAISGSSDTTLRVWDLATAKTVLHIQGANLGAYALDVSPDGGRVAVGCKDGRVREFGLSDGKPLRELTGHMGFVRAVRYTHDGRLLSSADDGAIRLWGPGAGEAVQRLDGHRGGVLGLAISDDDRLLLSGGRDATVRLWDLSAGKPVRTMEGHRAWVECVAFLPGGKEFLSAGRDGRILRWDVSTGKQTGEWLHKAWVRALACSPDGSRAFSAGDGGWISSWDLRTGQGPVVWKGHEGVWLGRLAGREAAPIGLAGHDAVAVAGAIGWTEEPERRRETLHQGEGLSQYCVPNWRASWRPSTVSAWASA